MKSPVSFFFRLLIAGLLLGIAAGARAQTDVSLMRHVEIVSYGRDAGEVQVVVGSTKTTTQVRMISVGNKIEIGAGLKLEVRQKTTTPEGKQVWSRVAEADLVPAVADFLVTLVPLPAPDEAGLLYRAVVLCLENRPAPASYTLANLTPVSMVVQMGLGEEPLELAPWSQHSFLPKTDEKCRALMRVAYRNASGGWEVLRAGIVSLPPDQAVYGRVVLAAKGMEELGDPKAPDTRPTLMILEAARGVQPSHS